MTGASTLWTLLSSTRISRAFAQRTLTCDSLIISHRFNCSICWSKLCVSSMANWMDCFNSNFLIWKIKKSLNWVENLSNHYIFRKSTSALTATTQMCFLYRRGSWNEIAQIKLKKYKSYICQSQQFTGWIMSEAYLTIYSQWKSMSPQISRNWLFRFYFTHHGINRDEATLNEKLSIIAHQWMFYGKLIKWIMKYFQIFKKLVSPVSLAAADLILMTDCCLLLWLLMLRWNYG